jgi:hypothetical protein
MACTLLTDGSCHCVRVQVQVFLVPVLHLVLGLAHLSFSFLLKKLNDLECTTWLLRLGWRPRRDFSLESILFSYAPTYILYINAYYITGIQVALKPLLCVGDEGATYLKYAPQIACWSDEHRRILVWDALAVLIYFLLVYTQRLQRGWGEYTSERASQALAHLEAIGALNAGHKSALSCFLCYTPCMASTVPGSDRVRLVRACPSSWPRKRAPQPRVRVPLEPLRSSDLVVGDQFEIDGSILGAEHALTLLCYPAVLT